MMNRAVKAIVVCVISVCAVINTAAIQTPPSAPATPQEAKQSEVRKIINSAETHYQRGQTAYKAGQYEVARREFDEAVDTILIESIDVRSDYDLRIYYRE